MTNSSGSLNPSLPGTLKFYEGDFTTAVPVFTQRVLGTSISSISSAGINETLNSAVDSAGNVLFYVFANCTSAFSGTTSDITYFVAYDSITGKDEVFATLPSAGAGASSAKNLNVVKKDGAYNQYYVIYKTSCTNQYVTDDLRFVTVNMNTKTVSSPTTLLSSFINEGMAVSVRNCALGNRWLFSIKYLAGNLQIHRSSISPLGISPAALIYTISIPGNSSLGQGDIEISPTSDRIAFVNFTTGSVTKDIIVFDLDLATGAISGERWINNPANYLLEVEFSPDGQRLYGLRGGTSSITPELYNILVPPAGATYSIVLSDKVPSVSFSFVHTLEIAFNGYLYFETGAYNSNMNYITNPNADAASNVVGITPSSTFGLGNAITTALPEQIDGEYGFSAAVSYNIAGITNICVGQSTTLTASGGTSYVWSGGTTSASASITVNPLTTTNYYLTAITTCGTVQDTVTVNVDVPVNVLIVGNDSICNGQSTNLSGSGSPGYSWSGGSISSFPSIIVSPSVTTTYYLSGISNACGSDTDTIVVFVESIPNVSISGVTTICIGQSTTLTASGGTSYV
ncbi:MAG: hypothetical protein H0X46_10555, partial [Bacteroidetes bacterium]|nr:hypothetical protein [Bacteroidota bacterium]